MPENWSEKLDSYYFPLSFMKWDNPIVNTEMRKSFSAFESILIALNPLKSLFPLS